jgi:hypothetical protein
MVLIVSRNLNTTREKRRRLTFSSDAKPLRKDNVNTESEI